MKCPYCKDDIRLNVWGEHSLACEDRKLVREEVVSVELEETPSETADFIQVDINDMSKDQLLDYLIFEDIEHDPKAKKKELLKLAKGE